MRGAARSFCEMRIEFARSTPDEADFLSNLALESKAHWGYPQAQLELWRKDLRITPEYIEENTVRTIRAGPDRVGSLPFGSRRRTFSTTYGCTRGQLERGLAVRLSGKFSGTARRWKWRLSSSSLIQMLRNFICIKEPFGSAKSGAFPRTVFSRSSFTAWENMPRSLRLPELLRKSRRLAEGA